MCCWVRLAIYSVEDLFCVSSFTVWEEKTHPETHWMMKFQSLPESSTVTTRGVEVWILFKKSTPVLPDMVCCSLNVFISIFNKLQLCFTQAHLEISLKESVLPEWRSLPRTPQVAAGGSVACALVVTTSDIPHSNRDRVEDRGSWRWSAPTQALQSKKSGPPKVTFQIVVGTQLSCYWDSVIRSL